MSADVYPDVNYEARVKFVGATVDVNLNFSSGTSNHKVPDKPILGWKNVWSRHIWIACIWNFLVIPRVAFLLGSIENAQVYVVSGDSVMLRAITIGRLFSNNVEVVNGLNEGEGSYQWSNQPDRRCQNNSPQWKLIYVN